jgi:tight adherence protein C
MVLIGLPGLGEGADGAAFGAVIGGACGWFSRDQWLRRETAVRNRLLRQDLPVALDLMSIAIIAGEGVPEALRRAAEHGSGPLRRELADTVDRIRAGASVAEALGDLGSRNREPALARCTDALVISLERGTPVARTLQANARELREEERRSLLEVGGRREIAMLLPIVFLVLPVSVVFALYPGLVSLELLVP